MNEYVTYICNTSDLTPMKTFTDAKGRTYEVVGQEIVEDAKQYQHENSCNFETALIAITKKENKHGL